MLSIRIIDAAEERPRETREKEWWRNALFAQRRDIIRLLFFSGPAADGPGAQAHRGKGGAGEDGAGQGE